MIQKYKIRSKLTQKYKFWSKMTQKYWSGSLGSKMFIKFINKFINKCKITKLGCKKKILQNCRWIIFRIIHVDVFTTSIWFPSRREIFKITQRDIKVKPTCIQYTLYFLLYTTRVYNITWTKLCHDQLWSDWANPKLMWLQNSRKLQNYETFGRF